MTGTLQLDAQGNNNAFWVFQIGSTLTTASGSSVSVINFGSHGGADDGVFWDVGSSATLGRSTSFEGNILALASITLNTTATILNGRVLAQTGAVTLDTNVISNVCPIGGPGNGGPGYSGGLEFDTNGNVVPVPPNAGVISGTKFNDLNANGVKDANEPGLAGWTVYVDYNNDGVFESATEPSAVTGAGGAFTIIGVAPGSWKVREVGQIGWTNTFPTSYQGGVSLSVARINVDLIPDIVVGAGVNCRSLVDVWAWSTTPAARLSSLSANGIGFAAFTDASRNAPVQVAAVDTNGDGIADEILVVQGPGGTTGQIRAFNFVSATPLQVSPPTVVPGSFPFPYFIASIKAPPTLLPLLVTGLSPLKSQVMDQLFAELLCWKKRTAA